MKHKIVILILVGLLAVATVVFLVLKNTAPASKDTNGYLLPVQEGLPAPVEVKRQAIYKAALSKNYETLAAEADVNFHYSFGGAYKGGFVGYLQLSEKDEGETAFDIIPILLKLPYAERDGLYTWPSVFTTPPAEWTAEDIAMMQTFLTDKQIDEFRQFGGYMYYRIGIKADGSWTFYLAGD